jgi:hypothetical protein
MPIPSSASRATTIAVTEILDAAPELDAATAERIAWRLHEQERPVTARAVADHLGLRKTDWVYANAERLGGCRLGAGKKPRWRFYLSEVDERLRRPAAESTAARDATSSMATPRSPVRRQRRGDGFTAEGNPLLDFEAC